MKSKLFLPFFFNPFFYLIVSDWGEGPEAVGLDEAFC